jgi:chromosome partitioning protein
MSPGSQPRRDRTLDVRRARHRVPISEIIEQREADLAVASIDLAGAELALSAMIGRERALEKALAEVRASYDYVLSTRRRRSAC